MPGLTSDFEDQLTFAIGLGIREVPLRGTGLRADADVAVWDVSQRSEWRRSIGAEVSDVGLHYLAWNDGYLNGFWCPRISLLFGTANVELLLGHGGPDGQLHPSGDDIAVLFEPVELPAWEQSTP